MARFLKSREKAKGAAPGSLIFMGNKKMDSISIRLFKFSNEEFSESEFTEINEAFDNLNNEQVNWLNIDGLHDIKLIKQIEEYFKISPLVLESILNTGQRARLFEDNNSVTIISKAIYYNRKDNTVSTEQISFVLLDNVLISFQERTGDHFEPVRNRIRNSIGRIRQSKADYLLYALTDCLIDNYMIALEQIGGKLEAMEIELINHSQELGSVLFKSKTEISYFRKSIKPLKEVLVRLLRSKSDLISENNYIFFQELYDLEEQAIDAVDNYFSMSNDLINLYNTNLSNRVNEVMKVLTIFASIFIPLTFIAGIYGTNFEFIPELKFRYAYHIMWGIMLIIAAIMLYYFKKHKWF